MQCCQRINYIDSIQIVNWYVFVSLQLPFHQHTNYRGCFWHYSQCQCPMARLLPRRPDNPLVWFLESVRAGRLSGIPAWRFRVSLSDMAAHSTNKSTNWEWRTLQQVINLLEVNCWWDWLSSCCFVTRFAGDHVVE